MRHYRWSAVETLVPDRVLGGRYRLRQELARGGMATVWLALPVAVRLYAPRRSAGPYPVGVAASGLIPEVAPSVTTSAKQAADPGAGCAQAWTIRVAAAGAAWPEPGRISTVRAAVAAPPSRVACE